jgi:hypothetical protein
MTKDELIAGLDEVVGSSPEAVGDILGRLAEVVGFTADHMRSNWQDESGAKAWEKIALAIDLAKLAYDREHPF